LDHPTQDKLAKINQLDSVLRKNKGFEDYAFDLAGLNDEPKAKLPEHFKMLDIDQFDSTRNPKSHLWSMIGSLQPLNSNVIRS